LNNGLVWRAFTAVRGDLYRSFDDPNFDDDLETRVSGHGGLELRFPMVRRDPGMTHVLEPVVQAVYAPFGHNPDDVPNDDSLSVEFDETNLFQPNRFPGRDRVEPGPRLNVGLHYGLLMDNGLEFDATVGQVFRLEDERDFSARSGVTRAVTDFVGALSVQYDPWFSLTNRFQFDGDGRARRNEVTAKASFWRVDAEAGYTFITADPEAGADEDREEVVIATDFALTPNWSLSTSWRRDLVEGQNIRLGGGIRYRNECVDVEFSVARRFTSSDDAPSSTGFGLTVRLLAFGGDQSRGDTTFGCMFLEES
jgi:LPS-assembly protein